VGFQAVQTWFQQRGALDAQCDSCAVIVGWAMVMQNGLGVGAGEPAEQGCAAAQEPLTMPILLVP